MSRVCFLDETLPICFKEYVEKTKGDTICMHVICQSNNNTSSAVCSVWEATPFKTNKTTDPLYSQNNHVIIPIISELNSEGGIKFYYYKWCSQAV